MSARKLVRVFNNKAPNSIITEVPLPEVFHAPIRSDIVNFVFYNLNKNRRQPYAVNKDAGMLYNAESWGTGRAVSRIPRVGGSGTHRSGQGAFGNMCRGGRRFNPTTIWRRWQRKVNLTQRRHAVASAIAASGVPSLILARGHRVNQVPEIPFVVDTLQVKETVELLQILERYGLNEELLRVRENKKVRPGQGKYRNKRYKLRRGPLIVYDNSSLTVEKAAKNIQGLDVCHIDRLNILQLAPGGHLGRLVIWTQAAFEKLDHIFGNMSHPGIGKKGYVMERPLLVNANIARIINSSDVQAVVRPKQHNKILHDRKRKNPLTSKAKMNFLNPYAKEKQAAHIQAQQEAPEKKDDRRKARLDRKKRMRKSGRQFIINFHKELTDANKRTEAVYKEYIKSTKVGKDAMKDNEEGK